MADKLIIALVNANPDDLVQVSLPLMQATVAASMDYTVEVILSGRAGKLGIGGHAVTVTDPTNDIKSAYDYIKEAYEAGVIFKICTTALDLWGDDQIPEINEMVGGTYLISEAMDNDTVTFTY